MCTMSGGGEERGSRWSYGNDTQWIIIWRDEIVAFVRINTGNTIVEHGWDLDWDVLFDCI
jgi:hypothetical protein